MSGLRPYLAIIGTRFRLLLQYRAAAQAPAAPTRAPQRTAPSPAAPDSPGGRDRGPSRLRPKAKWFRPKLRWIFLYLPLLVILLLGGVLFWGWNTFNGLYRVELGDALVPATGSAVNYLIVGSDSREGIEGDTPNVGVIGTGTEVKGRRSDTIIVLRTDGDRSTMMSIPRDLWATNPATGKSGRINATYNAVAQLTFQQRLFGQTNLGHIIFQVK